ncbi:hypothetical protein F2P56_014561 [Juglans regia]|uniref:Integrase zinc-binding domain-containing protein n=2 Tax=Juglans regia TaxID=51240 RepID=A0A833XDI1_JUGRE|nr:uncharacterized protein LOC108989257 [Juglans regia]KAF5464488.1 hypothetical protein F2P56_014561 [Juglans regia]
MYQDLKECFWWNDMKREIAKFVERYLICQQVKAKHQRLAGLLQSLQIPEWKREYICMNFVTGLPRTLSRPDAIWVIMDCLMKTTRFVPIKVSYKMEKLDELYVKEIVRLYKVLVSIVSDRDPRFTSKFWRCLQEAMDTRLNFNTTFHP